MTTIRAPRGTAKDLIGYTCQLDPEILTEAKNLAETMGLSTAQVVRFAVAAGLPHVTTYYAQESERREAMVLRDALAPFRSLIASKGGKWQQIADVVLVAVRQALPEGNSITDDQVMTLIQRTAEDAVLQAKLAAKASKTSEDETKVA